MEVNWNLIGKMLAVFLILASVGSAINYPSAVGGKCLYDFAGKLTAQEFTDLNKKLINYQLTTTNEIAVVTTQNLQGQPLNEYAKGLFNEWGVGRADVNNGVLILLSLDTADRGVWIQSGDGVDSDIDEDSIANNEMIPYFKNQQWASGLNAGVDAVKKNLPISWPAATTSLPQQNSQSSQPISSGQSAADMGDESGFRFLTWMAALVVVLLVVVTIKVVVSSRARAKKLAEEKAQQAREFKTGNQNLINGFRQKLAALEQALIPTEKVLAKLKESYPESIWGKIEEAFREITPNALTAFTLEIDLAEVEVQKNEEPQKIQDALAELDQKIGFYAQACADIEALLKQADRAKGEAQSAFEHLPERLTEAAEAMIHKDVTDKTRGMLSPVVERFPGLKAEYAGKDPRAVDWIHLNTELQGMSKDVALVVAHSREDKALAERARTEGPKMLAQMEQIERDLADKEEKYRASRSAQAEISEAREKIVQVRQYSARDDSTDWLQVYLLMNTINSHNHEADRAYHTHVQRIEQQRMDEAAASRRRSESSSFSGGHSGSSSSSSSFSGGHSGGGGGGGKF